VYRIEVQYRPNEEDSWWASIFDGDGTYRAVRLADSHDDALAEAQAWIKKENAPAPEGRTYYAASNGDLLSDDRINDTTRETE
jgi:hypothetical protein